MFNKKHYSLLSVLILIFCCSCSQNNSNSSSKKLAKPISTTSASISEHEIKTDAPSSNIFDMLKIVEYSYKGASVSVIIENSSDKLISSVELSYTAKAEDGSIIVTDGVVLHDIFPGRMYYTAFNRTSIIDEPVSSFDICLKDSQWFNAEEVPDWYKELKELSFENVSLKHDNETITGEIKNENDFDMEGQKVFVIIKDEDNNIEAVPYLTYCDIPANSSAPFQIDTLHDISDKNYELYWQINNISKNW